jgi:hypothetical protein
LSKSKDNEEKLIVIDDTNDLISNPVNLLIKTINFSLPVIFILTLLGNLSGRFKYDEEISGFSYLFS